MTIEINGKPLHAPDGCTTLSQLLDFAGLTGPRQAVAVDNKVVPRAAWDTTPLSEGMKVTVIRAVCGG
ncbi:MAG: sulfur carrier protein ThiS [Duncaniella sp.]|nr:sulfur carrier protein ThiS [Duncaniella sp.]